MKIALYNVVDNPFRNVNKYPLNPAKVETLIESIKKTGWWENIVGRMVGGVFQIAHGHHRLAALRALFKKTDELCFVEKQLTNAEMIRLMSAENDVRNRGDLYAAIESVAAAVQALADGTVPPSEMDIPNTTDTHFLRFAPSFISGLSGSPGEPLPYTALSLAKFLCATRKSKSGGLLPSKRVDAALLVLENQELGLWDKHTVKSFTNQNTGILSARDVIKAAQDTQYRNNRAKKKAKLQTTAATESLKQAQSQLDTQRKTNEEARKKEQEEIRRLAELAVEADAKEHERLKREHAAKVAKEKANEKERKAQLKEIEDRVAAANAARETAEKARSKAIQAEAFANKPPKGSEPTKAYIPEIQNILTYLEGVGAGSKFVSDVAAVNKQRSIINDNQRKAMGDARDAAVKRLNAVHF